MEEDWVMDSLDRYERLHVFELQDPTLCMEWNHDGTAVYVAGYSASGERHNELLQLLLPEKLLPPEKQTLLARRDFKIGRGAISKQPIHHIQCISPAEAVLATSGLGAEVKLWGPDPASPDLLVATSNIATPTPNLGTPHQTELQIAWSRAQPHALVTGSSLHTLQVLDLQALKPSWRSLGDGGDTPLQALELLSRETQTILTCSNTGELALWDPRQAGGVLSLSKNLPCVSKEPQCPRRTEEPQCPPRTEEPQQFALAVKGDRCTCLSGKGDLQLYDIRGASQSLVAHYQLPTDTRPSVWSHFSSHQVTGRPCVQCSATSNELSVSGLNVGVAVYDIITWSGAVESPPPPVFTHTGHEADTPHCKVTVHSWHPSFHSMILSCDSDGTMHAWQWKHAH